MLAHADARDKRLATANKSLDRQQNFWTRARGVVDPVKIHLSFNFITLQNLVLLFLILCATLWPRLYDGGRG